MGYQLIFYKYHHFIILMNYLNHEQINPMDFKIFKKYDKKVYFII